jgi:hypothetical protein
MASSSYIRKNKRYEVSEEIPVKILASLVLSLFLASCKEGNRSSPAAPNNNAANVVAVSIAPTALLFTNASLKQDVAACGELVVSAVDASNAPRALTESRVIVLITNSTAGRFFADKTCETPLKALTIIAGSSNASAYYRDRSVGNPTITAGDSSIPALTPASQTAVITAARPSGGAGSRPAEGGSSEGGTAVATEESASISGTPVGTNESASTSGTPVGADVNASQVPATPPAPSVDTTNSGSQVALPTAVRLAVAEASLAHVTEACGPVIVTVQDAAGSSINAETPLPVSLVGAKTGIFYSDQACTQEISGITIASGVPSVTVYYRDSKSGSAMLAIDDTSGKGLLPARAVATVAEAPKSVAVLTSLIQDAGACGAVSVGVRDRYGDTTVAIAAVTLNLIASTDTGRFFSDSACTKAVTTLTITPGTTLATVYYMDSSPGRQKIIVVDPNPNGFGGYQGSAVIVGGASALQAMSQSPAYETGACGAYMVGVADIGGSPVSARAATTLIPSSTSGTGAFYSDKDCTQAVSTLALAEGDQWVNVYYRDDAAGSPTLSFADANSSGLTKGAVVTKIAAAGTPVSIVVTSVPLQQPIKTCGAVTLGLRDVRGESATAAGLLTIKLSTTSPGGGFYSDSNCTETVNSVSVAAGAQTASFYYLDQGAGPQTLTIDGSAEGLGSTTSTATMWWVN